MLPAELGRDEVVAEAGAEVVPELDGREELEEEPPAAAELDGAAEDEAPPAAAEELEPAAAEVDAPPAAPDELVRHEVLGPEATAGVPPDWATAPRESVRSNCRLVPTGAVMVYEYGELWTLPIDSMREVTAPLANALTVRVYGAEPPVQVS